jgi:hypothetical protein
MVVGHTRGPMERMYQRIKTVMERETRMHPSESIPYA